MNKTHKIIVIGFIFFLSACSSSNIISEEERKVQDAASEAVSSLLFDNELESLSSYNVRKSGYVVIKFDKSVKEDTYTRIVEELRKLASIKGVFAEQGGKEVCPVR